MIISCPDCGFDIDNSLSRCPHCGCRLEDTGEKNDGKKRFSYQAAPGCSSSCGGCIIFILAILLIINFFIRLLF